MINDGLTTRGDVLSVFDERATDGLLTADELEVRTAVREICRRDVAPRAAQADAEDVFVADSYRALARAGLGGVSFARDLGGRGSSTVAYGVAMEEIAAVCGATSLVYMTQTHAAYPITLSASEELRARLVPPLLGGRTFGSMAISEPEAGSDAASMRTTARRDGDHYVLNGSKTFITTGNHADVIVVFATVDPLAGHRGVTAFVLETPVEGLVAGRPFEKMGMHGSPTAELFFDDVVVPLTHRLGDEGSGWPLMLRAVMKSRVSAAAQGIGLARGALTQALVGVGQLGFTLSDVDRSRLADFRTELVEARLLMYATARVIDQHPDDVLPGEAGMMKIAGTDLAMRTSLFAIELLGAAGDFVDLGVERYMRDAKVTQIYDGTNEIQRLLIARDFATRTKAVGL